MTTTYSMTPISNGTRLRTDHALTGVEIAKYNIGQRIVGDMIWEAPADGVNVKKGDKWLHVISVDGVPLSRSDCWMAYIHRGQAICTNFQIIEDTPTPAPIFPESFTLVDPSGAKAEYAFVRIIEE